MIQTDTLPITPQGMNRAVPQQEISDTEAWTLHDAVLDTPGLLKRRGPLQSGFSKTATQGIGIAVALDPASSPVVLTLDDDSKVRDIQDTFSFAWPYAAAADDLFYSSGALAGGTLIGSATGYGKSPTHQGLALSRGAAKADQTSESLSSSISRGDATITFASGTNLSPGQFVFKSSQLVGVISSVSGAVATLEEPALIAATTSVALQGLRGLGTRTSKGRITTDTTSAVVNGGDTKFKAQGLASGTWDLFTPDKTYIGTVTSVQADAQLTLVASAAVSLLNADYIAIKRDGSYAIDSARLGWITEQYGGHQFYAKGDLIAFSDTDDPEATDLTANGDTLIFSPHAVRALRAAASGLVSLSENEAHVLVGGVGTTPDRWRGERIHDDGTICGMSAVAYKDGVIWAGKRGVWFWNGADPVNLVGNLGEEYRSAVDGVTLAWGAVVRDHYLLHLADQQGDFSYPTYSTTAAPSSITLAVNLRSGAITYFTNVELRGWADAPDSMDLGKALLSMNGTDAARHIVYGDRIFTEQGATDELTCSGNTGTGPYLSIMFKRYSLGDGQRVKLFKQLQMHYFAEGVNIKIATVKGLNDTAVTSTSEFLANTEFQDKRLKPKARSQYCAYQLFESSLQGAVANNTPATPTQITIGEIAIGFKWKRPGRV